MNYFPTKLKFKLNIRHFDHGLKFTQYGKEKGFSVISMRLQ